MEATQRATPPASVELEPISRQDRSARGHRSQHCEECFEHLDRYVELELAGRDADAAVPGMRAHLEGCPACDEDHDNLAAIVGPEPQAPGG